MKRIIITLLSIVSPLLVLAHPGHGHEDPLSPRHYVANPEHSFPMVLTIAAVVILINWLFYRSGKKTEKR